jgi:homoserine kinase type II
MSAEPSDRAAAEVLARYPAPFRAAPPVCLGNAGGFSGARLWRLPAAVLRAWPPDTAADRVAFAHRLMTTARAASLAFVPGVAHADAGATCVTHAGRLWDVVDWLPGRADFHETPTAARLAAACRSLAELHACWAEHHGTRALEECPAVRRRLDACRTAELAPAGPALSGAERLLLRRLAEDVPRRLAFWAGRPLPAQPCHGDPWHDHVLFDGDRLTGLIDYGAARADHVAADLARLLGSLVEDDEAAWAAGLTTYRAVRMLTEEEEALVRALDRTGTVLAAVGWAWRLEGGGPAVTDRTAATRRLAGLLRRLKGRGFEVG